GGTTRHPAGRSPHALSAALQPRPQPHRAALRQAQTSHANRRAEDRRGHMAKGRTNHRPLLPSRMRKLSQKLRICFRMKTACSRPISSAHARLASLPDLGGPYMMRLLAQRSALVCTTNVVRIAANARFFFESDAQELRLNCCCRCVASHEPLYDPVL